MRRSTGIRRLQPAWFKYALVGLLIVGIIFRFINLDKKVYWHDEVYTSLRITAHTRSELVERAFNGNIITPADLQEYQQIDPNRGFWLAMYLSGIEDAQHPPLYYAIAYWWVQVFGTSISTIRSLSAISSLLIFPCLYWLCLELFESRLVTGVAIALMAVSPFQVLFAQEAREYSLWATTILLCSAALLYAIRRQTKFAWTVYGVSLIVSLHTFLFTGLVAIGHSLYVLAINPSYSLSLTDFRVNKSIISYVITSTIALIVLLPWFYFIFTYIEIVRATSAWSSISLPPLISLQLSALNFSRSFVDFGHRIDSPGVYWLIVPFLLLQLYSLYFLCSHTPPRVWLFVLTLIGSTALILGIPDLIIGGQRFTVTRYLIPCFLGLQLSTAYLIAAWLSSIHAFWRQMGLAIASLLIVSGILSCAISSQAETWWNKVVSYDNPKIAKIINASENPIVVSDAFATNPGNVVSLSYLLNENVRLLLLPEISRSPTPPDIPEQFSNIFFLDLPNDYLNQFQEKYRSSLTLIGERAWQLKTKV
ncbi:glycosyltransferase family 39 protein [Cyanobacteria bacterium FACHB-471]|nr:glycosyltransferase family 39 protein [Cyanobacteria bacterium FACHB-471]